MALIPVTLFLNWTMKKLSHSALGPQVTCSYHCHTGSAPTPSTRALCLHPQVCLLVLQCLWGNLRSQPVGVSCSPAVLGVSLAPERKQKPREVRRQLRTGLGAGEDAGYGAYGPPSGAYASPGEISGAFGSPPPKAPNSMSDCSPHELPCSASMPFGTSVLSLPKER